MSLLNVEKLCRLCLTESESLYRLDSDFNILILESGAEVTIVDALKYLNLDITIPQDKNDQSEDDENTDEEATGYLDDPSLPNCLCKECLESLQTAYEFKFRCEENKIFLKNYLKEQAEAKSAEEKAAKEAALIALDLDVDNLDKLPDRLVLKKIKRDRKPRKPRDPLKPIARKKKDEDVIIAEDSQLESATYVRKLVTTPDQSPDTGKINKRKSKHIVIADIVVKPTKTNSPSKRVHGDDEPIFEDDENFEKPKKRGRPKKISS